MMQMSHQNQHLHTGQVPTASQQPHHHPSAAPHLHGQQLQINAQQQHTMSHHQQHQVMTSQQQQQSHINMTSQHFGLSASHNANVVQQSMDNMPMAQQPHYMNQQINHSQLQQLQRQQYQQQQQQHHQFLQHQQQPYRQGQLQQVQVAAVPDKEAVQIKPQAKHEPVDTTPMLCVRRGCTNLAIISDEWEDEYCSNECAVSHCREVFNSFHKGDPEPNYTHQTF